MSTLATPYNFPSNSLSYYLNRNNSVNLQNTDTIYWTFDNFGNVSATANLTNGTNIRTASEVGAVMDAELSTLSKIGGGVPTDNTTVLNTYFSDASPSNAGKIIIDGGTACTQIFVPGNTFIEGTGFDSGFMRASGTSIPNVYYGMLMFGSYGTNAPETLPTNIGLRDVLIEGNQANVTGTAGNLYFWWVQNGAMDNVWNHDSAYFNTLFVGCNNWAISNCRFESTDTTVENTDGIHIDGPAEDFRIENCHFRTNDDAIALNCPEGYPGGNIDKVAISNCTFDSCLSAIRVYCYGTNYSSETNQYTASNIVASNLTGSITQYFGFTSGAFLLGFLEGIGTIDAIQDFSVSNFTFELGTGCYMSVIYECIGNLNFTAGTWKAPVAANSWIHFQGGSTISNCTFNDCRIYQNTTGNSAAYLVSSAASGATIGRLEINGFSVVQESGQSFSAVPYLIDMLDLAITELVIGSLDPTNITALVNPTTGFTGVGSISGPGVLATGFQIPDSVMANNCPYISATSYPGMPCIKLAGTVYQFTVTS